MMNNLFSIFDPSTSMYLSNNWFSMIFSMIFIPSLFWFLPSRIHMFYLVIMNYLVNELFMLMSKKFNLMNMLMYISLFIMIMMNNLLGMFPYIFTASSHMSFGLSISLSFWISFMLFGWFKNTNHMFIHLVPQGTPVLLMMFMVIIETVSNIIRPGTLAVRLSANMIAGHLLMTLISSTGGSLKFHMVSLMLLSQSLLIILELSVAVIQAYVFMILSILYSVETN